jgi:hypothetical protein
MHLSRCSCTLAKERNAVKAFIPMNCEKEAPAKVDRPGLPYQRGDRRVLTTTPEDCTSWPRGPVLIAQLVKVKMPRPEPPLEHGFGP